MYFVPFLLLSGFIICSSADKQTHDIHPEATCQNHNECLTLSDIVNEKDKYFTSDSILVFHEGEHILQREVVYVFNVRNFTLQSYSGSGSGLSSPTITCNNSFLFFSNVSIAITSIGFSHCSIRLSHAAAVVQDSRFENGSAVNGGALAALCSRVQFDGANSFTGNMAERYGGAVYADRCTFTFSGTTVFAENEAHNGGAVYCGSDTSFSFSGNMNNTAAEWLVGETLRYHVGGTVYPWYNNTFRFNGNSSFMSNTAVVGGAVYAWDNNTMSFNGNSSFMSNTADYYGGAVFAGDSNTLSFNGNSSFISNTADYDGGAVSAGDNNTLSFNGNSSFMSNTADYYGGAVFAGDSNTWSFHGNSSFMSNTANYSGGAVSARDDNTLSFNGNSSFMSNTADYYGGAVFAWDSNTWSFNGNSSFMSNTADFGGAVYTLNSNTLSFNGNSSFMSNTADYYGGAMFAGDSNTWSFHGNSGFISNTAEYGSAVSAGDNNTLIFNGNSSFMSNTADYYGGAVFAWDSNTLSFNGNNSFMSNIAAEGGAVYAGDDNTLSFNGNSSFISNTGSDYGGAVSAWDHNILSFNGNSSFINNTADFYGGAVSAWYDNTLSFNGNSSFMSNTADFYGSAVFARENNTWSFHGSSSFMSNAAGDYGCSAVSAGNNNTLSFNGDSSFMNNTADHYGGAVSASYNNTLNFNGNSSFISNTADNGGAVYALNSNTLSFNGNNTFTSNAARLSGGAVFVGLGILRVELPAVLGGVYYQYLYHSNNLSFNGRSSFTSNKAGEDGGAVYLQSGSLSFRGSTILFVSNEAKRGGGIALLFNSQLHLSGMTSILSNFASFGGGAFAKDSSIDSTENIRVIGNHAVYGGGLFIQSSNVTLQSTGLLVENTATNPEGGYGGAMFTRSSIIEFKGFFGIANNTADFGGGLAFFGVYNGVVIIKDGASLNLEGNLAHRRGGAIYVEDDPFAFCAFDNATHRVDEVCFFQTREGPYNCFDRHDSDSSQRTNSTILKFDSNIANVSGDTMYGGHLESCVVCSVKGIPYYNFGVETFRDYVESEIDLFSKLSSDPYKVCLCEYGHPNCDPREVNRTVYPGQVLVTSLVAVGQMNGIVPSVIRAVSDDLIDSPDFRETQPTENSKQCSQLQYPLFSSMPSTSLKLYSDEPCSTSGYSLTFLINFLPCPVGFSLSEQACICDERLQTYTQNCSIQNLTISRDAGDSFWVGVEGTDKLILHPHCPYDYCAEESVYFPLNNTDMQCANGRSGILCGACQPGRGLALGSSRCLSDCSNRFLALLLAFAFAGVALVAFLFLCHLTVAEGTLSGLIFYANVLAVNQTVFFPSGERNLLTVFIAWMNLDLGVETCFFASLDAYYKMWLQFAFPIYIWVVVGVIIVLADRSTAFAKIIANTNPVAVLATLFLLSYTKLLRAIMAAFSFTTLDYPDGDSKYVWLHDGNIDYLDRRDGRHIALFLFSLLFLLFIFFPYTLFLLCGQWIQKKLWWLSSTKQLYLKFFLDAHYGPYKNQHHYWTGLLLLLRFFMLFVATITNINNPQDPYSNLLVILVVSSSLILWGWIVGRLYKKWYHNVVEGSLIFNLLVLAGGTYQVRQSAAGGNQAALVYTSVSIAFVTFIGIVLSAVMPRVNEKLPDQLCTAIRNQFTRNDQNQNAEENSIPTAVPMATVTYSVVEIEHIESGNAECESESTTSESIDQ